MSQEPPRKLDYRAPRRRLPEDLESRRAAMKFFGGLAGGILLSALVWPLVYGGDVQMRHGASVGLPLLKMLIAAGFMTVRRWQLVGAGILASMAVGCLIFLSQCGR